MAAPGRVQGPLVRFRGQWVELDRERMQEMLAFWRRHGQENPEMSIQEVLQRTASDEDFEIDRDDVLADMLERLRDRSRLEPVAHLPGLKAELRDYQKRGVAWLRFLDQLGLNGCLADDMGLTMTQLSKTWWGQRFIAALEGFTDSGRLQRGRGTSGESRILAFAIADGLVTATVRGNVNPYYGVYQEPRYQTRIRMAPIPPGDWDQAITQLGSNAALVAKLLMGEMPDNIDAAFAGMELPRCPAAARTSRSPSAPARTTPTPASTSPGSTTAWRGSSTATPFCSSSCAASPASGCTRP